MCFVKKDDESIRYKRYNHSKSETYTPYKPPHQRKQINYAIGWIIGNLFNDTVSVSTTTYNQPEVSYFHEIFRKNRQVPRK